MTPSRNLLTVYRDYALADDRMMPSCGNPHSNETIQKVGVPGKERATYSNNATLIDFVVDSMVRLKALL